MWTLLFIILLFMIFGKILVFAVKAAWSVSKILVSVVMLPAVLVFLVFFGLIKLALPLLLIVGIGSLLVLQD